MKARKGKFNRGTSFLEVLSSIAIIVILASLLVSAIYTAREKGRMAVCINNLKNLTASLLLFANDKDQFPTEIAYQPSPLDREPGSFSPVSPRRSRGGSAWAGIRDYYDHAMGITKCPKIQGTLLDDPAVYSYGINQLIRGVNLHKVEDASQVIVIGESLNRSVLGKVEEVDFRHLSRAFAGFADGHVELVKLTQLESAPEDLFGSPVSNGATGNGVLFKPGPEGDEPPPEEIPPVIEIPFTFTDGSVCSNGFRWDFLGLTDNGDGTKTLTFNITNSNNRALSNASFGLPDGVSAVSPADGSLFSSGNKNYQIENMTENPFHAIKFNTIGEGIKNGQVDTFLFTLNSSDVGSIIVMRVQSKGGRIVGEGQFETGSSGTGDGGCGD